MAKSIMKLALGVAAAAFMTVGAMAEDMPGSGKTVKMAQATWDTGWFQAEIYRQALQKLGYEVSTPTTLDNPPFYQSVGQGDIDLWVNGWFSLHDSYAEAFEEGAEKIGYVPSGDRGGFGLFSINAENVFGTSFPEPENTILYVWKRTYFFCCIPCDFLQLVIFITDEGYAEFSCRYLICLCYEYKSTILF